MEDISRELEKEIDSYSSPVRIKRKTETRLIAVDDFGKMKPADWIKKLVLFLFILSMFLTATTILFFKLYSNYKFESNNLREKLDLVEAKVKKSVKEQEYLMAKLVISDSNSAKPDIEMKIDKKEVGVKKTIGSKVAKTVKKRPKPIPKTTPPKIKKRSSAKVKKATPPKATPKPVYPIAPKIVSNEKPNVTPTEVPGVAASETPKIVAAKSANPITDEVESESENIKNVAIERFMIVKEELSGDLLIRFRVLNVASEKGDASGRVFVVLSSKNDSGVRQLVVPAVSLENNIPTVPRRGQYFLISHFKPVKFRIRNIPNPELYDKATVLIFGKENALILNEEINISIGR